MKQEHFHKLDIIYDTGAIRPDWLALPCCRHMEPHDMGRRVGGLTGKKTWEVGF